MDGTWLRHALKMVPRKTWVFDQGANSHGETSAWLRGVTWKLLGGGDREPRDRGTSPSPPPPPLNFKTPLAPGEQKLVVDAFAFPFGLYTITVSGTGTFRERTAITRALIVQTFSEQDATPLIGIPGFGLRWAENGVNHLLVWATNTSSVPINVVATLDEKVGTVDLFTRYL